MIKVGRVLKFQYSFLYFVYQIQEIFHLVVRTTICSKLTVICKSRVIMINNSDRRLITNTYLAASVEATKINIQGIVNIMDSTLQSRLILPIATIFQQIIFLIEISPKSDQQMFVSRYTYYIHGIVIIIGQRTQYEYEYV